MKDVAPRHGQKQGRPWLVSRAPEQVGQYVTEKIWDQKDLKRVKAEEAELDAEIAAVGPWCDRWWRLMKLLDRVRGQRIALELKLGLGVEVGG